MLEKCLSGVAQKIFNCGQGYTISRRLCISAWSFSVIKKC
uniref:Uncharacterized protein n=1 Tax=Anguilla anguilla TaxID=7936 RepID=A0A0E9PU38_ANGAN